MEILIYLAKATGEMQLSVHTTVCMKFEIQSFITLMFLRCRKQIYKKRGDKEKLHAPNERNFLRASAVEGRWYQKRLGARIESGKFAHWSGGASNQTVGIHQRVHVQI